MDVNILPKVYNSDEVKMAKRKKKIAPNKTEKRDDNYYRRINGLIDKWNDETEFGDVTAKCIDIRRTWNSVTFLFSVQLDASVAIIPHTAFYPPDEENDPVRFKYAKPSTIISLLGLEWTKESVDDLPFCVPVGTFALGTVHVGQSGKPYFTPSALVDVAIPILREPEPIEPAEHIDAPHRGPIRMRKRDWKRHVAKLIDQDPDGVPVY